MCSTSVTACPTIRSDTSRRRYGGRSRAQRWSWSGSTHGTIAAGESSVHVHLQTEDGRISGHLETIQLAPGARVAVPVAGWSQ